MKKTKIAIAALSIAGALGTVALPLSTYADTNTGNVTVTVKVGTNLSIALEDVSSEGGLAIDAGSYVDSSSSTNRIQHKLTATSNLASGYKLTIQDSDETTSLTSGSATIPSVTGTGAQLAAKTAGWGWQVVSSADAASTNSWNAVPANNSAATLYTGSAQTEAVTEVKYVRYGVATAEKQVSGTYTDAVIYTILANS